MAISVSKIWEDASARKSCLAYSGGIVVIRMVFDYPIEVNDG